MTPPSGYGHDDRVLEAVGLVLILVLLSVLGIVVLVVAYWWVS